ncbi:hypothetical protein IIA15_07740 [candidate division TA06 bacterium]|nr:hypothetical protein [candidate division TA06 bacterium]
MVDTYEIGRALDLIHRVEDEFDGRWKRMDADSDPPTGVRPNQTIEDIRQLLPAVASLM